MKSDVCKLNGKTKTLRFILDEVEKAAIYRQLEKKEALQLRLLAEELIGMLPELLKYYDGEFWIESNKKAFELHASMKPLQWEIDTREHLLSIATSGKNEAAKSIMGKIRVAAEMLLNGYSDLPANYATFYDLGMNVDPSGNMWSLATYMNEIEADYSRGNRLEEWDELEKSIIANLADDVTVKILSNKVDIVIKKDFSKKK